MFQPLTREQLAEIVELQLARLRERLAERGLALELTDAAKERARRGGWDPAYGARPLKRALQRLVENPLALRLLEGEFAEGDTVLVDARDGELVFEHAPAAEPAARVGAGLCPARGDPKGRPYGGNFLSRATAAVRLWTPSFAYACSRCLATVDRRPRACARSRRW